MKVLITANTHQVGVCLRLRCRLIVDALGVDKIGIAMVSVDSITRGMGSQGYIAVNS